MNKLLSGFSDNMWKRIVIKALEKKNQLIQSLNKNKAIEDRRDIDMEVLVFGLLTYNPRIQFNFHDDNITINSDGFKALLQCCNKQAIEWKFPTNQKWETFDDILDLRFKRPNVKKRKGRYEVVWGAAQSGDMLQLESALKFNRININDAFNEDGHSPLLLAIQEKHWKIVSYCLEKGARIDVREGAFNAKILQAPLECIIKQISKEKDKVKKKIIIDICKLLLERRAAYPMKQIEYAIDYVKDKLIDEDGVKKKNNTKTYGILLLEGAAFLLGKNPKNLEEVLDKHNLSKKERSNEGWCPSQFLIYRIFSLFKLCIQLKWRGEQIVLPEETNFKQVYKKVMEELQVQLTTYWDYITTITLPTECPELINIWSYNVVNRLTNLKPGLSNECSEISLMVGHKDHCIYLSLCKISDSILVRVENQVPYSKFHRKKFKNNCEVIQPYLLAYFQLNTSNTNKHKIWLKDYIKEATKLRNSESKKMMEHLYGINKKSQRENFPRVEKVPEIAKKWPYLPVQIDARNCHLRSDNVGYCIRTGEAIYKWSLSSSRNSI
ncbi:hypothetical protein RFI_06165 [Reticulomyxa filosa]|uniref:Uncharacterized protein n=1 Tax=Reticulomyxa filosa TaxID=46433 RepID=X6NYN8_RETFI|nr:hypothetical protein RFI_06165 [Reticulomyxa filosa]|eukprot:ETO30954.1 hypothetical protein RFI_06165 [Reticulomyxa filosa]